MRRHLFGVPLYFPRTTTGVQKPRSRTPSHSTRYAWSVGRWFVFVSWSRYEGFTALDAVRYSGQVVHERREFPNLRRSKVKKPTVPAAAAPDPGQPSGSSVVLKKFPRLFDFLSNRWYENGEPRWPGSLWIDSDALAFRALLKEPSLFLQTRIRAATVDDLFAAVETFLGLDAPPWEPDAYAHEKAVTKKKK